MSRHSVRPAQRTSCRRLSTMAQLEHQMQRSFPPPSGCRGAGGKAEGAGAEYARYEEAGMGMGLPPIRTSSTRTSLGAALEESGSLHSSNSDLAQRLGPKTPSPPTPLGEEAEKAEALIETSSEETTTPTVSGSLPCLLPPPHSQPWFQKRRRRT